MGFDMNYKIKVANEVESKEVQELVFELDYSWPSSGKNLKNLNYRYLILLKKGSINWNTKEQFLECDAKEITIPELRDLVVLKRNLIEDATHTDQDNWKWYVGADAYVWQAGNAQQLKQWDKSDLDMADLKPIEKKEMKDYLEKQPNGSYVMKSGFALAPADWIEIPEGAECLTMCQGFMAFWKKGAVFFLNGKNCWDRSYETGIDGYLYLHKSKGCVIVWQRESPNDKLASAEQYRQAEVLPFIDDEPDFKKLADLLVETTKHKPTAREWDLSDYDFAESDAWIESNVEQDKEKHSHYKKDISHLGTLDIYRITELFNPHSCGAHIAKKALCSGQRGHKDLLTDIQDIIDTAERWKEMLIEDEIFDETEMPF